MKDVGLKLQEKRTELKLSHEEVAKMTRLPIGTIKAIEAGDLDYFQDDLTYVRFYVRQYCKILDVPYENFKDDVLDSVEDYTTTMSLNMMKQKEDIEQHIAKKTSSIKKKVELPEDKGPVFAKKDRTSISQNAQQNSRFRKAKKIDFAFLSLIVVIAIVVVIVLYVAVTALLNDNANDTPSNDDDIADVNKTPTPEVDNDEEENKKDDKKDEETSKITFEQNAANHYSVGGIKAGEAIKIEITFTNAGSFNLWKGNTSFAGAYGMYDAGATYTYDSTVTANELITLNFWNYGGAEIKINGQTLEYNSASLSPVDGVTYFQITTKGE